MINLKPRKIIFVGSESKLIKLWAKDNETEVVSSVSFLNTLVQRFFPDLIVFDSVKNLNVMEIRKNQNLSTVPVLVVQESFKELDNLNFLTGFPGIILCNESAALSEKFYENILAVTGGKKSILPARTGAIVKYALLFMNKNFGKKLTRESLASQVGVSGDYLTKIFREEMGLSLWDYLVQLRLNEAKSILTFSALSVNQVSAMCGFSSASYFNKAFKKAYGISPGHFYKKI